MPKAGKQRHAVEAPAPRADVTRDQLRKVLREAFPKQYFAIDPMPRNNGLFKLQWEGRNSPTIPDVEDALLYRGLRCQVASFDWCREPSRDPSRIGGFFGGLGELVLGASRSSLTNSEGSNSD